MPRRGHVGLCLEAVARLDAELAMLARSGGRLRYSLGLAFEALARKGGHHELGFSSFEAYALERGERSARWAQESRAIVRRTRELPGLRDALISGAVSWSMARELARVATPESEASWLSRAAGCTVAEIGRLVDAELGTDGSSDDEAEERCVLTITADVEEVWLFECVRLIVHQMDGGTANEAVNALVGEAYTSLMDRLPRDAPEPHELAPEYAAQNAYNGQRRAWREEGERLCERRIPRWSSDDGAANDSVPSEFTGTAASIDAAIRRISAALEGRDVRLGELAEQLWEADGPRRLGYATDGQYARERLGMSLSAINDKRRLSRQLSRMPHLATAVQEYALGYEAARIVGRVATAETEAAWTERAGERTLVHLREEVTVAEHLARVGRTASMEPPEPETVTEWLALRSAVITGKVFVERGACQKSAPVKALAAAFASAKNGDLRHQGRETLRLRVAPEVRGAYRGLERLYGRYRPTKMSFLRFACLEFIQEWAHARPDHAYAHIYLRDGLRCTNPTCNRRDVTPHHTVYRSQGGGDEPENLTSLCVWCHLRGVHGGRIRVRGRAPSLEWELGAHTTVTGRTRKRAA